MSGRDEKRIISDTGYCVLQSSWAGGKEYLLAENPNAGPEQRYLVCQFSTNGIIGEYADAVTGGDYAEAQQEYCNRILAAVEAVQKELDARGLPAELFTAEHCLPNDSEQEIKGKVVAIKEHVLAPEYRRGSEQLVYVTGGFGAHANSRGNAVFCYQLSDGKQVRFERYQVLGIIKEIPAWAQERLAGIRQQIAAERAKSNRERSDAR